MKERKRRRSRILLVDVESSFQLAGVWGRHNVSVNNSLVFQNTHILSWAAKWLDDEYMYSDALFRHSLWKKEPANDSSILETLAPMLEEAEAVVAHNGNGFDIPLIKARMLVNGMKPLSPFKKIDTYRIAKREFRLDSYKLDEIAKQLGLGRKLDTGGAELWADVVYKKDKKAFRHMLKYNEQDVWLLEDVYKALRPWDTQAPHSYLMESLDEPICPACGSSHIVRNGYYTTNTGIYKKFKCSKCGHNLRTRFAESITTEQRHNILRSL